MLYFGMIMLAINSGMTMCTASNSIDKNRAVLYLIAVLLIAIYDEIKRRK